jgi:hypothetical protein
MLIERLDAEPGETDDEGRKSTYHKVAALAVAASETASTMSR